MKRVVFAFLLGLVFLFGGQSPSQAADAVKLFVNGGALQPDVPPQVISGRTLVPVRFVAEALGASVGWDEASQTVTVRKDSAEIKLIIAGQAYKNGRTAAMDVPAQIIGGRAMIPIRFVSEALGAAIRWDEAAGAVYITSRDRVALPLAGVQPSREDIFSWEAGHHWSKSSGNGSATEEDKIFVRYGQQSLKLIAGPAECRIDNTQAANLINKHLALDFYVHDVSKLKEIHLIMDASSNWESYFGYPITAGALKNGWNSIALIPAAFYRLGANPPDYSRLSAIKRWRIRVVAQEGQEASVSLDRLQSVQNVLDRGLVSLTFDDGFAGVFTEAKPQMDRYGFSGVAYVITGMVDKPGRMTVDQLKSLQDAGWDISSHTRNHVFLVSRGHEDGVIEEELAVSKKWLTGQGFDRGARHLAVPGGEFNNRILGLIKKYYATNRTIIEERESYPPADQYMLKIRNVINTTPVEAVQKWVDEASVQKEWLILVFHNFSDSPEADTQILPQTFRYIIDYIAGAKVDVVTMSDAVDNIVP